MFTPVRRDAFSWSTPDPEAVWMMVGHLIARDSGCVLVDPPLVPGLLETVARIGKVEGILLTSLDHSRGASYIAKKSGATLYLPDQEPQDVDPRGLSILKEVPDHQKYSKGKVLGLKVYNLKVPGNRDIRMPSMNEYSFLTDHGELITGDFVTGSSEGRVLVAPEWFPVEPACKPYQAGHNEFRDLVHKTGASSLLASHGFDILGTLQREAERL